MLEPQTWRCSPNVPNSAPALAHLVDGCERQLGMVSLQLGHRNNHKPWGEARCNVELLRLGSAANHGEGFFAQSTTTCPWALEA